MHLLHRRRGTLFAGEAGCVSIAEEAAGASAIAYSIGEADLMSGSPDIIDISCGSPLS